MKQRTFSFSGFLKSAGAAGLALALACALPALCSCVKKKQPAKALGPSEADAVLQQFHDLQKHLQQDPKDARAWYDLADIYDQNNVFDKAADAYRKAAELKPAGYTYLRLGMCYDALNKPREAVAAYQRAVKLMPFYAVAFNNLGVAYGKAGENGNAIASFKKAAKLDPYYPMAKYDLGYAYMKKGDRKGAMEQYRALENLDQGLAYDLMKKIKSGTKSSGRKAGA